MLAPLRLKKNSVRLTKMTERIVRPIKSKTADTPRIAACFCKENSSICNNLKTVSTLPGDAFDSIPLIATVAKIPTKATPSKSNRLRRSCTTTIIPSFCWSLGSNNAKHFRRVERYIRVFRIWIAGTTEE